MSYKHSIYLLVCTWLFGCDQTPSAPATDLTPEFPFRPNIVWIVAEDMSGNIPAFGDSTIQTPALTQLAREGVSYDNLYTPSPVCAPARSSIITGMYPVTLGTHNMRTGPWWAGQPTPDQIKNYKELTPEGIGAYEAVVPEEVKMFTEYLRQAGYYTSNNSKEDYQFLKTPTAWDACSNTAHWRDRNPGQPFFAVFNLFVTHESQLWEKAGDSLWVDPALDVPVPPYLPDTEVAKNDIRRMYSNIKEMDNQVAEILNELEKADLLDSTIIFWYTDHGGPLPRQKRSLHDSGMKVPMIIRFPGEQFAGSRDSRLISFVDLAPSVLSLAGIKPADHMQGTAFIGAYTRETEPQYIFAAADRFDQHYDQSRAVRGRRYKYIRHYQPEKSEFMPVSYRDNMPIMQELYRLRDQDSLTDSQKIWFAPGKPEEALYDTWTDPHEIINLADDPDYQAILTDLRRANENFIRESGDKGFIEEKELMETFWPGGKQPETASPLVTRDGDRLTIACDTPGASLGYRKGPSDVNEPWIIYQGPVEANPGDSLEIIAHRIGYAPSDPMLLVIKDQGIEQISNHKRINE